MFLKKINQNTYLLLIFPHYYLCKILSNSDTNNAYNSHDLYHH